MYKIKFPIGDHLDDGHGGCEWFIIRSNKPVHAVRLAHVRFKEKAKFSIGQIANELFEPKLNHSQYDYLDEHNLLPENLDFDADDLTTEDVMEIWMNCLMHADETLVLSLDDQTQTLPAITDASAPNGEEIRAPGYGVFTKAIS